MKIFLSVREIQYGETILSGILDSIGLLIVQAVWSLRSLRINASPFEYTHPRKLDVLLPPAIVNAVTKCVNLRRLVFRSVKYPYRLMMDNKTRPFMRMLEFRVTNEFIYKCLEGGRTPSAKHLILYCNEWKVDRVEVVDELQRLERDAQRWFWNRLSADTAIHRISVCHTMSQPDREKNLMHVASASAPGFSQRIVHIRENFRWCAYTDAVPARFMVCNRADTVVLHDYSRNNNLKTVDVKWILAFLVNLSRPPRTVILNVRILLSGFVKHTPTFEQIPHRCRLR